MSSLQTELIIARTFCTLAQQENGNKRFRHVELAKEALATAVKLACRVTPGEQERDEIEEVRWDILSLDTTPDYA